MADEKPVFPWRDDGGLGLSIEQPTRSVVAHEVMYEQDVTHVTEHPLFLGPAISSRRFLALIIVSCMAIGGLAVRATWVQLVHGKEYQLQAEQNRLRHDVVTPRRGLIRDRAGVILAENIPAFVVSVVPRELPTAQGERDDLLATIGRTVGMTMGEINDVIASSTDPNEQVVLQRDVPYDRAIATTIIAARSASIRVTVGSKRRYPMSQDIESLSHLLGYIGGMNRDEYSAKRPAGYRQSDLIGKTGVEASYESLLRGEPGEHVYEVDSLHRITATVGERAAIDGGDLRLSIDVKLQAAAEQSLRREIERAHAARGAVVAIDPRDGSILALVSWPSYDNNMFSGKVSSTLYAALIQDANTPMLPRAWAGTYPSGSTIKPIIATAALAEGVITPRTSVHSVGGINVGPWFFPDWKPGGHGTVNVRTAIAWSVNTFFYYVGGGYDNFIGLGVDRLTKWMRTFGLGGKTGIDVPGEQSGFVPSQEWKKKTKNEQWFIGDTYNLSIGQGDLLVTPLQVAAYTAAIANGGHRVTPHLILSSSSSSVATDLLAPAEAIQAVRLGMRDTVTYGSGRALASLSIAVAGKTGTAQWRSDKPNHAWFTSFAPFDAPKIAVTVLIEEGVEGSVSAVPVAKDVYNAWVASSAMQH